MTWPATADVAHRDDRLADRDPATDCGAGQATRATKLQHCDILGAVVADHVNGVRSAVANVERADIGSTRDNVVVGQHDTAWIDNDAGSGSHRVAVAEFGADVDQLRPNLRDHRRRVERGRRPVAEPVERQSGRRCMRRHRDQAQAQSDHSQHAD
jgi:hypothetical protein